MRRLWRRLHSHQFRQAWDRLWNIITSPDVRLVYYEDGTIDFIQIDGVRRPPRPRWFNVVRKDPCVYCGEPGVTADHITPLAGGGIDSWHNIAGACKKCNNEKGSGSMLFFLWKRDKARRPYRYKRHRKLHLETDADRLARAAANKARCAENAAFARKFLVD